MIWKSKKLLVLLSCLVCSLLAGFFTSLTAHAYDITTNVSPTGKAWEWGAGTAWRQAQSNTGGETNNDSTGDAIFWGRFMNNTYLNNTWILKTITSGNTINFQEGYYYKTQLSFNIVGFNYVNNTYGVQVPQLNRLVLPNGAPYKLVSITPLETSCEIIENGSVSTVQSGNYNSYSTLSDHTCFRGGINYDIIVQATQTATGRLQLGDGASWFLQSNVKFAPGTGYGTLRPLTITEYKPDNASVINQEQQEAGQQAQQDGQTGADSSQSQAQQGGQTLLQGFSSFVGALTSASASDCVINGNIGDFEMGNMDLCQLSPPPAFQAISSIMVIGFVVPLSIATIRKFIGIFRSFQNG